MPHPPRFIGTTTQDLRNRFENKRPARAEDQVSAPEQRMRTRGSWMVIFGIIDTLLVLLSAIIWHVGFGQFMPSVYATPLYAVGFGSIFLGAIEAMFRSHRTLQNDILQEVARIETGLRLLVHLLPDELQQRWYAGYSSGHEDGRHYRTGTDDIPMPRAPGDVLRLHRRNDPPCG
jgi:uncharacterized integral membrane protein